MNEIDKCLSCEKPECDNCLGPYTPIKRKFDKEQWFQIVKPCVVGELTIGEVAREIGVDRSALKYWVKKYKAEVLGG